MEYIDKKLLIKDLEEDGRYKELLSDIESGKYDVKDYESLARSFVGKELNDFYCNGFFGRTYDLDGAEITKIYKSDIEEITIEVKKSNGEYDYGYFEGDWCEWQYVYEHLEQWVNGRNYE
jgi:hypothetical protein